ncbi:MAG: DUF5317 family protein [Actinomycetota bacterium]
MIVAPVLLGVVIGWARRGRLGGLGSLRLRAPLLVFAAVGAQLALGRLPATWRWPVVLGTYAAVGLWVGLNVRGRSAAVRAGLGLVALGWAMNLAAMAPYGGMPVSVSALRAAGFDADHDVTGGHLYKHVVADDGDVLARALGDSVPVPPLRAVISSGDIVLAAGIATVIAGAMGRRPPVGHPGPTGRHPPTSASPPAGHAPRPG